MKRIRKDLIIEEDQIEFMKIGRNKAKCYLSEIFVMKEIQNPFLVNLQYLFENEFRIYLIMDYFPCGDLYSHCKKLDTFTEEEAKFIIAQIAIALGSLHKQNIIHRDLKPENILFDKNGYCYLTDFGLSKVLHSADETSFSTVGTPEYSAPEIINKSSHTFSIDWWALGVLTFELIFGITPFKSTSLKLMDELIVKGSINWPDKSISTSCFNFISRLLLVNPKKRLGSRGAIQVLQHSWLSDIDIEKLASKELEAPYQPRERKKKRTGKDWQLIETVLGEGRKKLVRENEYVHDLAH